MERMTDREDPQLSGSAAFSPPQITLPKGGGAIRGIDEKFKANPATGTGALSIALPLSPGRSGFGPQLSLEYDSGAGNGIFGVGWSLSAPRITRRTDKGLPQYRDDEESDVFILSGAEDLVPVLRHAGSRFETEEWGRGSFRIKLYRPRIEGLFARIERWTSTETGETHWRSISKDNVLTVYGLHADSRVADPEDPTRVFSWLIAASYDDKGNGIIYDYVAEDTRGVSMKRPSETGRSLEANRYPKRIRYGNRVPLWRESGQWGLPDAQQKGSNPRQPDWMFELVFDYDEGHCHEAPPDERARVLVSAGAAPIEDWSVRSDPFSTYRSRFEIRTYRLCRRVLMFHHFQHELGSEPYLVRSLALHYHEKPIASFLTGVVQSGHSRTESGCYLTRSLPKLELAYSKSPLAETKLADYRLQEVGPEYLENLPIGIDNNVYRFVDLDGEGIAGVLTEQDQTWFYKPNLGDGRLGATERVASQPSLAALRRRHQEFMDLGGDGNLDLVDLSPPTPGFYERMPGADWLGFRPFRSLPVKDWDDPNLRFVDLTGDGAADVLITEDNAFNWNPSLAREGFGETRRVATPFDERHGPRVVFADGSESIYLADMSGDGLADIVRIRNGEVCYWPNLGYGEFGAKLTMGHAPWFAEPDCFDQRRIRLADTDGSGLTDILYLDEDGISIFLNQSGNGWSDARRVRGLPAIDDASSVTVSDFLGRGTACLLWSSPLPTDIGRQLRYVDLMAGVKPHLLIRIDNNLGAETRIHYASSTKFYLADKAAGTPWITRLPFAVHVVERVETRDYVARNQFVTSYTYHHGYYDGLEREFRGFGRVDQLDTEELAALAADHVVQTSTNRDPAYSVPPVLTKTWFHTGVYLQGGRVSRQLAHEYYREGSSQCGETPLSESQAHALLLEDTILPPRLSPEEAREASRALKGTMLRQEIFALDGTEAACRPYSVTESNMTIRLLQRRSFNRHSVFFPHAREDVSFHYDRAVYDVEGCRRADPRVFHRLTLDVDEFGNVRTSVAVGYGRRFPAASPILNESDRKTQARLLLTLMLCDYTNPIQGVDSHRIPLRAETRSYELLQMRPTAEQAGVTCLFRFLDVEEMVRAAGDGLHDIPYEDLDPSSLRPGEPYRRLIGRVRTLYRPDDLGAATGHSSQLLSLGVLESRAIPGDVFRLAFTRELLDRTYQRHQTALLPSPSDVLADTGGDGGGYADLDGNGSWWIPSGRVYYSPDAGHGPAEELSQASQHFFLPRRFVDQFDRAAVIDYDRHDLLVARTTDAVGNTAEAINDYRVLQATLSTDPNGNRSAVQFDALGLVVGTAVMGKPGEDLGDSLAGFTADLDETDIDAFFSSNDPREIGKTLLSAATTRAVYDVGRFARTRAANPEHPANWEPAYAATLMRETHHSDPLPPGGLKIQISFRYSDGFGRVAQQKVQAEPKFRRDDPTPPNLRWVGTGWTIFNNKGNPVRQYEPFFSELAVRGFRFEFGLKTGVSPIILYDPVQRVVGTLYPNHSFEKSVFDPWYQENWDVNDTALIDPRTDQIVCEFVRRLPPADYLPSWYQQRIDGALGEAERLAAEKTAGHAATPTTTHLDSLGRVFLTVANNGGNSKYATRSVLDVEGHLRTLIDPGARMVARYEYDMAGAEIRRSSMDAGTRWMLNDATNKPIRVWNSRGYAFRLEYDALRRPLRSFVEGDDIPEFRTEDHRAAIMYERTIYGDSVESGLTEVQQKQANLRGKVLRSFDGAGLVVTDLNDFKGNPLRTSRQFTSDYKRWPDWSQFPELQQETFAVTTTYDALNRATTATAPDCSVYRPTYDEGNRIDRIEVRLRGAEADGHPVWTAFVTGIDYNARGQRTAIRYASCASTYYDYDPDTFRLIRLKTARIGGRNGVAAKIFRDSDVVQDLRYTYDPIGNITRMADDSLDIVFHANQKVSPVFDYSCDPLYRLTQATGRENIEQAAFMLDGLRTDRDYPFAGAKRLNDIQALQNFVERYQYDAVGNLQRIEHRASQAAGNWTRAFHYEDASRLEPGEISNRLSQTWLTADPNPPIESYRYDVHGNIVAMPHLPSMRWDFKDELSATSQQVSHAGESETTYYAYDHGGQRARKVSERAGGDRKAERLYVGGFEVYRTFRGNGTVAAERETLRVMDDKQQLFALVETRTIENGTRITTPDPVQRFQFANHLGSVALELSQSGELLTYEEYGPYGCSTMQAGRSVAEVGLKRYRFAGQERDHENGFVYQGARYYAPWLGRWIAPDPAGFRDGPNPYCYAKCRPVSHVDVFGLDSTPAADRLVNPTIVKRGNYTGHESQAEVHKLYASIGLPFRGDATWDEARHSWFVDRKQLIKPARHQSPGNGRTGGTKPSAAPPSAPAPDPTPSPPPPPVSSPPADQQQPPGAGNGDAPPKAATAGEAAEAFAVGALKGAAIGFGLIALGSIGTVIGVGLLAYGAYKLATGGYKDVAATAERLVSGNGTADDYEALGGIVGGIAAGGAAGMGRGGAAGAEGAAADAEGAAVTGGARGGGGGGRYYIPRDANGDPIPLPTQRVNGVDIPLPDPAAQGPHTVLGGRVGSDGVTYRQSATFPGETWPKANGQDVPWGRVDWHDHSRPWDHTTPHMHPYIYDSSRGGWTEGPRMRPPP